MQEFGGASFEADGSVLAVAEGEQNSDTLCRTLLQTMGNRMEKNPLKLDAPSAVPGLNASLTKANCPVTIRR